MRHSEGLTGAVSLNLLGVTVVLSGWSDDMSEQYLIRDSAEKERV